LFCFYNLFCRPNFRAENVIFFYWKVFEKIFPLPDNKLLNNIYLLKLSFERLTKIQLVVWDSNKTFFSLICWRSIRTKKPLYLHNVSFISDSPKPEPNRNLPPLFVRLSDFWCLHLYTLNPNKMCNKWFCTCGINQIIK
jgi:hypothetical protein